MAEPRTLVDIATPNKGINRSAEQRRFARCSVPVALCAPAPGYAQRWALSGLPA